MISMYADDILLCKPIHHPENYDDLQRDIGAIHECINTINIQPFRMQISNCIKEEATTSPTHWSGHWQ